MIDNSNISLYPIAEALEEGKIAILNLLSSLANKTLDEKIQLHDKIMEEILVIIGDSLHKAAINYTQENILFYFWPGYTTLEGNRILISGEELYDGSKHNTGIGYFNNEVFYNCPSTIFYDAVLTDLKEINYIPPTTHLWKFPQNREVNIKLRDKSLSPLKFLHVEASNISESIAHDSFLHVKFDRDNIEDIIASIGKSVHDNLVITNNENNNYIQWPINIPVGSIFINNEQKELLIDVQKSVYPIWFLATFTNHLHGWGQNDSITSWIVNLTNKLNVIKFSKLSERIYKSLNIGRTNSMNKSITYKNVKFDHWYTLFFDSKSNSGEYINKTELGSAMFLTDKSLPYEYLFIASAWVEQIYGLMRMEDLTISIESKSYQNATLEIEKENQHKEIILQVALAHYIKNSMAGLAFNENRILAYIKENCQDGTVLLYSELQLTIYNLIALYLQIRQDAQTSLVQFQSIENIQKTNEVKYNIKFKDLVLMIYSHSLVLKNGISKIIETNIKQEYSSMDYSEISQLIQSIQANIKKTTLCFKEPSTSLPSDFEFIKIIERISKDLPFYILNLPEELERYLFAINKNQFKMLYTAFNEIFENIYGGKNQVFRCTLVFSKSDSNYLYIISHNYSLTEEDFLELESFPLSNIDSKAAGKGYKIINQSLMEIGSTFQHSPSMIKINEHDPITLNTISYNKYIYKIKLPYKLMINEKV